MADTAYKRLKKKKSEKFAQTLRNHHNGLLQIPDLERIVQHAGDDAEPLLPYLMSLLATNHDKPAPVEQDPFVLLDRAGYVAFHADTLEKQNSIKHHFEPGELLCTFNDAARHKNYHIVHAVKKDVEQIRRKNFNGKETRQDEYGTSVISIQMLKKGGFISIKNRYNHTVSSSDSTFDSNPDKIIEGLSTALKQHFNVDFSTSQLPPPDGFTLFGNQIFKYHEERNNIYYGNQAWAQNGTIHSVDRGRGDGLFDGFLFDNKTKTLKKIDPQSKDSFAEDFNRDYGGNSRLSVDKMGSLTLDGKILIGIEKSRIKTLDMPSLTKMSSHSLHTANALTHFSAPMLTTMGSCCLENIQVMTHFSAPLLTYMSIYCLWNADALTHFSAPALTTMSSRCLYNTNALTHFFAPALTKIDNECFRNPRSLKYFSAPALTTMGNDCFYTAKAITHFSAPLLSTMGSRCFYDACALTHFYTPALTDMDDRGLYNARALIHFSAPALNTMGHAILYNARALIHFSAPTLTSMGNSCLYYAPENIRMALIRQVDMTKNAELGGNFLQSTHIT